MTPFDTEGLKMAQRSQRRLAQAFQMYVYFVATGTKPDEALKKIDAAMDSWTEYEDAHSIEMPAQFSVEQMMAKFGEMAANLGQRQSDEPGNNDLFAVNPDDVTRASVDYCERVVQRAIAEKMKANPQLVADVSQEAYFAGAAMMLRLLHGAHSQPFPYLHGDLRGLLEGFNLLAAHAEDPGEVASTAQQKGEIPK